MYQHSQRVEASSITFGSEPQSGWIQLVGLLISHDSVAGVHVLEGIRGGRS